MTPQEITELADQLKTTMTDNELTILINKLQN